MQIALTDQSLFSIPANSNFRLEDFQQDSASQRLFTRLLSGAVRFISGQTASTEDDASLHLSLGSITDGQSVIDGRLGLFSVAVTPQDGDAPALAAQAILAGQEN